MYTTNFTFQPNVNEYFYQPYRGNQFMPQSYVYSNLADPYHYMRQPVRGAATWTDGGQVTKCGIPWSHKKFMTAAVGINSPYRCGQSLKIRNLSTPGFNEIIVTVVDEVASFPANKINLHRKAFEALGAALALGVIDIEIVPVPETAPQQPETVQQRWGDYLFGVLQTAYPEHEVINYQSFGKMQVAAEQAKETYDFVLQSHREKIMVRGTISYNQLTNRILAFDFAEL